MMMQMQLRAVQMLAMMYELKDGMNEFRTRLTTLEKERPQTMQHPRVSPPAPQPGAQGQTSTLESACLPFFP